ncbi:MAG: BON domain-containing protein [Chloroflexota bacterium]|nr:BON domain-containing protein [Chloroflexota bacterium]
MSNTQEENTQGGTNQEGSLARRIERELETRAAVNAVVEVRDGEIILSGRVDTVEAREAADDIVAELAPGQRLTNDLEVEQVTPTEVSDFYVGDATSATTPVSLEALADQELAIDPDFTDQPLSTSGLSMSGVDTLEEDDTVFFPPTDPVITTDDKGQAQVLGGFSATSDASIEVDRSTLDGQYGDEAIADAVRRELREDAATTDLRIDVSVRTGIVHLRGEVRDVDDTENAEEVASRVPGVKNVVEELRVADL